VRTYRAGDDQQGVEILNKNWQLRLVWLAIGVLLTIAFLLVSPLLLLIPEAALNINWQESTDIGQSYTGIAAVLSAAALAGIAVSIRIQGKQTRLLSRQITREMQSNLLQLAMSDPQYSSVFQLDSMPIVQDHDSFRKAVFRTQWIRYLELTYLSGEVSDIELLAMLEQEFFTNAENRLWWSQARPTWAAHAIAEKVAAYKQFVEVLDRAHANRETSAGEEG
jgi:hypothetical protein